MSISRETFDAARIYKRVRCQQDFDLLDSELNEQQDILHEERRKFADRLFMEGSLISGLGVAVHETSSPWVRGSTRSTGPSSRRLTRG